MRVSRRFAIELLGNPATPCVYTDALGRFFQSFLHRELPFPDPLPVRILAHASSLRFGACARIRTWDPISISDVLYQLSYTRIFELKQRDYSKKYKKKQENRMGK